MRVAHQLAHGERPVGNRLDGKAHVEGAALDGVDERAVVRLLRHLNFDFGPAGFEPQHHLRQHLVGDALIDTDAQAPRNAGRVGAKVRLGGSQPGLDRLGVAEQQPAGLRQLHRSPPARTLDEALPDKGLQRSDVVADGGQRSVQPRSRRPERARVRDRPERAQVLEVDALPIIRDVGILRVKQALLRSLTQGTLKSMEILVSLTLLFLLAVSAQLWGVDSRPADLDRVTRWWPGSPRD